MAEDDKVRIEKFDGKDFVLEDVDKGLSLPEKVARSLTRISSNFFLKRQHPINLSILFLYY